MDRRGLLKSLLAAPAAAIVFNKTSEAEEKIKYIDTDLRDDKKFYELTTRWNESGIINPSEFSGCACSGTYRYAASTGMW